MRLRKYNIKHWTTAEINELKSLVNTMTNQELCQHFTIEKKSLALAFRKFGIQRTEEASRELKKRSIQSELNPAWKGGISKDHARYLAIQRERYPERNAARDAVYEALKKGILKKPESCQVCGEKASIIEGHHKSYEKDKWLDVDWLCKKCHRKEDRKIQESSH